MSILLRGKQLVIVRGIKTPECLLPNCPFHTMRNIIFISHATLLLQFVSYDERVCIIQLYTRQNDKASYTAQFTNGPNRSWKMWMSPNNKLLVVCWLLWVNTRHPCVHTHTNARTHIACRQRVSSASERRLQRLQSDSPVAAASNRHRYRYASPHTFIRLFSSNHPTDCPSVRQYPAASSYDATSLTAVDRTASSRLWFWDAQRVAEWNTRSTSVRA